MNSLNHSPHTYISEWLFETLAGIRFDRTTHARQSVRIAPLFVDDLTWAEGTIETPNGPVSVSWERNESTITLDVTIPWNTAAQLDIDHGLSDVSVERAPDGEHSFERSVEGAIALSPGVYRISIDTGRNSER